MRLPANEKDLSVNYRRRLLGVGLILFGMGAQAAEIRVSLDNPPGTGTVVALLFDSPDAFADLRDPLQTLVLPANGQAAAFPGDLPPGDYAVMVFHDENGNGELDKNFIGIPREPLGFSNRYWAKGPPTFSGASFTVTADEDVPVDVELKKIFGKKGLFGVGVGAIAQSSPFRGTESGRVQVIPAVTYIGERLQILGPFAQLGLTSWKGVRLAATAQYRLGAYEESDSPYLEGMGDRKDSLFCGLALQTRLPAGLRISAGVEYDVLGEVGGGSGRLGIRRGWQIGKLLVAPSLELNGLTTELARHEFGVTAEEARADRPEYDPGAAINIEPGLGLSAEWFRSWRIMLNGSVEFLAPGLRDSPLVDESQIFHVFGAVNYTF
jgi:outer membrane protein